MLVKNVHISAADWDAAVAAMPEANPFMYSWALDALCAGWKICEWQHGIFLPVPIRYKYNMPYAYQVPFLPFFSLVPCASYASKSRLGMPVPFIDMCTSFPLKKGSKNQTNYIVQLFENSRITAQRFSIEGKRNIEKSQNRGCEIRERWDAATHCKIYHEAYGTLQHKHVKANYAPAVAFAEKAFALGKLIPLQVVQKGTDEVLSSAWILKEKNQLFYWMAAPTALGRQCRSTYFLINHLTQAFAGQCTHLQLLGSDIDAVAHFYRHFGGVNMPYFSTKYHWLQPFGVK